MGIPVNNMPMPPQVWRPIYEKYAEHSAWYSGDVVTLGGLYAKQVYVPSPQGRFNSQQVKNDVITQLHVPIAGDIASTSANLLFGEAPSVKIPEAHAENASSGAKATQDRLDEIMRRGEIYSRLLEAAETCSALGGVYIKPNWDVDFQPFPVLNVVQADAAIPQFKWGFLDEVSFWTKIEEGDRGVCWWFVEHHTKGKIYNLLYKGTKDNLGNRVGLTAHPHTMEMQDEILTGIDDLVVRYIPNMKPNRLFRGTEMGRSDYQGSESLLDSLNMVYTSWIRDIKLGQARIIVPESWLEKKNGQMKFDVDQEIFTTLDVDPLSAKGQGINQVQFNLRVEEHRNTAMDLIERIVSSAGYSPQSFGLKIEGSAESGTALNIRERKSIVTKGKKEVFFKNAVEAILEIMLMLDKAVFKTPNIEVLRPQLEFQDSLSFDINQVADSIEKLNRAQAISVKTKTKMAHPDWTEEQLNVETKLILEEQGLTGEVTDDLPV